MMRVHALVALAGGAAVLVACSGGPQQVDASAPTVTYSYKNEVEMRSLGLRTDNARPADRWPADNGEVTFVCVPNN